MQIIEQAEIGASAVVTERRVTPLLTDLADVERAARAVAGGALVACGFANTYGVLARPDVATVRVLNVWKGRPADQTCSVSTTPVLTSLLFDWSRLPLGLSARAVLGLMDALFDLGPFGFRGPAAAHVPTHLTCAGDRARTVQAIAPGYACPSNALLAQAVDRLEDDFVAFAPLEGGVGGELHVLDHADAPAVRRRYPRHATASPTVLSFHRVVGGEGGRPCLTVERRGSLAREDLAHVAERFGLDVA